jgi:four helix bundle protein
MGDASDELPFVENLNRLLETDRVAESRSTYSKSLEEPAGFKRLIVYQRSMDLMVECYRVTRDLPSEERFGLMSQIRRASISVPLNIGEGWGLNSKAQFARTCDIARGSTREIDAALHVMKTLGYQSHEQLEECTRLTNVVSSMLLKLTAYLRRK